MAKWRQFLQRSPAGSAEVPFRLNGLALTAIHSSAILTAPGKLGQRLHFIVERVVDRNRDHPAPVHLGHLPHKIRAVIRLPLQDVELPLMNHFMGQGVEQFLLGVGGSFGQALHQRLGETDLPLGSIRSRFVELSWARASATDEHADGRCQAAAPGNGNFG